MSNILPNPPQDFDEWAALAQSDPQAFEAHRHHIIDKAIMRAPTHRQHRLRCLQWKLDQIRNTSRTPMIACLRMNRMLWEAVAGDNGLLSCLQQSGNGTRTSATVIPIR